MALSTRLRRTAYRAQQLTMLLPCLAAQRVLRLLTRTPIDEDPDAVLEVQRRYSALMERDLANAESGMYPESLLFQMPIRDYARRAPALARDIPRAMRRMRRKDFKDLPNEVDLERYPDYFRRNFHWQTDGYFSLRSAEIYDVGVELLFLGTADIMRRQVIPPITRFLRGQDAGEARLLDVACGTGRTLHQIAATHPDLRCYGLDLSPYYLQHARRVLADLEHLSLVADNAEAMPFRDGFFDVVTSVYLFHELPKKARHNVFREMFRVLRPGGLVVVQDSAQLSESGDLAFYMSRFSREFHEPYHGGYIRDDIGAALAEQGFEDIHTEAHFVAKVVWARKPAH